MYLPHNGFGKFPLSILKYYLGTRNLSTKNLPTTLNNGGEIH
jgi:hypothetical protein